MEKKRRAAIIGGKLQGTEACYLARKAGIHTILIDRNLQAPARFLANEFRCLDVCEKSPELIEVLQSVDFVLPAMENDRVLYALRELMGQWDGKEYPQTEAAKGDRRGINLAFDFEAYGISSSKVRSDHLIRENGIPAPVYYPDCQPPYIVKPSSASGSAGVIRLQTAQEVERFLSDCRESENWVAQEYLNGASYSIEVIGKPGHYKTYGVTEIHMDSVYDCCKVTTPCPITHEQKGEFARIGVKLAELLKLSGVMDVEVILHNGLLKVLEIDARLPSQTPICVYWSTGINFMEELADLFCCGQVRDRQWSEERFASFEHHRVTAAGVEHPGEHIMGECGPLHCFQGFLGADEVLTDYEAGDDELNGTFILFGETAEVLEKKRRKMIEELEKLASEMAADNPHRSNKKVVDINR